MSNMSVLSFHQIQTFCAGVQNPCLADSASRFHHNSLDSGLKAVWLGSEWSTQVTIDNTYLRYSCGQPKMTGLPLGRRVLKSLSDNTSFICQLGSNRVHLLEVVPVSANLSSGVGPPYICLSSMLSGNHQPQQGINLFMQHDPNHNTSIYTVCNDHVFPSPCRRPYPSNGIRRIEAYLSDATSKESTHLNTPKDKVDR
jgi:hypothetical protein